jgi:hypothetical protein
VTVNATSPAASGPAGSHVEGQVGAYYLLSMLTGAEPRGLSGTVIDRVEFQRAPEGYPLDDVIIHAHNIVCGDAAIIEIQVKRDITFAPSDPVFRKVVGQIAEASRKHDFWTSRHELAVATARISRKVAGAYQDVLTWTRQLGDATTFMNRIARPGLANEDMRTFVSTFRTHLLDAGSSDDAETVWGLLRRLQILFFDFTAPGSVSEDLAKERAVRALQPDDASQAVGLWTSLVELSLEIAASGGDRTRDGLVTDPKLQPFRLVGQRSHTSTRKALAEASRFVLDDIGDRVGGVMLTRHEYIAAVRAALDRGRYVEIRGDAGVGKSGVLKHFAEQVAAEGQIIVLNPVRTAPGGWPAMRAVLGFDGTARDLLSDLAGNGGAVLFVDNLDFYSDAQRATAVDLVREAAKTPGFAVIATARRDFGTGDPNWLPEDALNSMGRADPIIIGELSDIEVDEIRHAAPGLAPLLANNHPARDVTRNLFRLARLAIWSGKEAIPHTEADMAQQWWRTADGQHDESHRDRARLLKSLAEQALVCVEPLDVSGHPPRAIDALVTSETLREVELDRVAFRHDVLREWAIGNLLHAERSLIDHLPLDRPASPALARGIELATRMATEHAVDGTQWHSLVERLSVEGTHGSWRRAALLALVRSEVGPTLLSRASSFLLADRAVVLRELIHIVMAVDVEPASALYAAAGVDPAKIPPGLHVPSGPSWHRLIRWLLSLGKNLPAAAIPDVLDLYRAWSMGMLGRDPLTPSLLQWEYKWLTDIEKSHEAESFRDRRRPFGGEFTFEQIRTLESDLRTTFLLFCNRAPELAVEYLESLGQRRHGRESVRSVLKFRGALAQAAPAELTELTLTALIPKPTAEEPYYRREPKEPFDFVDHEFLPASPAQGPFLELLIHSPQDGLTLIRKLVDHAISFYSRGRECDDAFIIPFPDGERMFPWKTSYAWSREWGGRCHSVTSGLMALEVWSHRRIEAGETFDKVFADVLGPPGSSAAYLLVAVDLLLTHWPKSCEAVVPFVACPELLCIDRQRHFYDNREYPDFFGLKALQDEPTGADSAQSLKEQPSRRHSLYDFIGVGAVSADTELRESMSALLRRAAARLGPPGTESDLGDPTFMVVHALNLVDPKNWHEVPADLPDGTQGTVLKYVPPEAENKHLARLQEASRDEFASTKMQAALDLALEDSPRSSPEFAAAAVEWARNPMAAEKNEGSDDDWMREHAVISAAMIAMRDGAAELREQHAEWARGIFAEALKAKEDPIHRFRTGIRHNPIAIAFAGMIHLLKHKSGMGDVKVLLEVAARDDPAAAHGLGVTATALTSIDERLPRAVLRCAFAACIQERRECGMPDKEGDAKSERYQQRVRAAIDAELAWVAGERSEPEWPTFPSETVRRRRGISLFGGREPQDAPSPQDSRPNEYADHQAAAVWLKNAEGLVKPVQRPWTLDIVRTYAAWTAKANGAGLDAHEQLDNPPREWNGAYFDLLANCLPGLALAEIGRLALERITSLPEEPFFDIVTGFLRSVDCMYFGDRGLEEPIAIAIRTGLAKRLMLSSRWSRLRGDRSTSIDTHVGPAVATFFFNDYPAFIQPPKCYLLAKGIDRLDSFLPVLQKLAEDGPSLFVALITLNLLEVSPRPAHLPFMVAAANAWLASYADDSAFWVDQGIGTRVCAWIEDVWRQDGTMLNPDEPVRTEVDRLLAGLIRTGVAEARRLEDLLARM